MLKNIYTLSFITILFVSSGCAPEVGSEAWCKALSEKPKGEWTANEAKEYATSCLFK